MRLKVGLVAFVVLAAACGGGEGEAGTSSTAAPTTENTAAGGAATTVDPAEDPTTTTAGGGSGSGQLEPNGSFTLDGASTDVTIIFCGFEGETGNDDVLFSMRAQTFEDGAATWTYDGTIIELPFNTSHSLEAWEGASTATPPTYEPAPLSAAEWDLDGNDVRFESEFVDQDGASVGTGVFEGACP